MFGFGEWSLGSTDSQTTEGTDGDGEYFLPTLPLRDSVPRITGGTLVDLLNGVYDPCFNKLFIVDCRYPYEYYGGHIRGAVGANDPAVLEREFFSELIPGAVIIFHCEFSHNRGPQLAGIFREFDRERNAMSYPNLFYPNVFVLDGGYRQFFYEYQAACDGSYTSMLDDYHRENGDLTRETTQYRMNIEQLESRNREALVTVDRFAANQRTLTSPVACGAIGNSPIASRMLGFMASPIQHRYI